MGRRGLVPLLCVLSLLLGWVGAIEVKWTPADGDGPEPASKRYRESMARLRELEAQQAASGMTEEQQQQMLHQQMLQQQQMQQQMMMQQQQQQRPPGFFERVIITIIIGVFQAKRWATRHPRLALGAVGAVLGLMVTKRACEENGLVISRRPLVSVFRPPLPHLANLLETVVPQAPATGGLGGASSMVFKGEAPAGVDEVVEEVEVGRGELAYRFAGEAVRTHKALDSIDDIRFYTSEEGGEGVFVLKPGRLWVMMPVRVQHRSGTIKEEEEKKKKKKKKKKEKKGGKREEVYEEVVLESVEGCPWRGELRIGARHKPAARKGEEGPVTVQVKWMTSSRGGGLSSEDRAEIARAVTAKVKEVVAKEQEVYRIREKQRLSLLEGAKRAEEKRAKKERDRLLHPEPNRAQLRRRRGGLPSGGDAGLDRWRPSADFVEARRGRGKRG